MPNKNHMLMLTKFKYTITQSSIITHGWGQTKTRGKMSSLSVLCLRPDCLSHSDDRPLLDFFSQITKKTKIKTRCLPGFKMAHSFLNIKLHEKKLNKTIINIYLLLLVKQEAQLPQRDSASAAHVFLGSLTDRALHWAPDLFYNYIID